MKIVSIVYIKSPTRTLISRLLKALRSIQAMKKKQKIEGEEQEEEDKRVEEKRLTFLLVFMSSTLESVAKKKRLSVERFL